MKQKSETHPRARSLGRARLGARSGRPQAAGVALAVALSSLSILSACGGGGSSPGGGGVVGGSGASSSGGGAGAGASSGGGGAAAGGSTAVAAGECAMELTFTTVNYGGRYAPRNVSAVWVTDPQGAFVRTLEENGRIREQHLGAWEAASGGNTVDAVTGATNAGPREHQASWDCTDTSKADVPPGKYTVSAEFTSDNTGGVFGPPAPLLQVQFDVGSGPQTLSVPDNGYFTGVSLTYQ